MTTTTQITPEWIAEQRETIAAKSCRGATDYYLLAALDRIEEMEEEKFEYAAKQVRFAVVPAQERIRILEKDLYKAREEIEELAREMEKLIRTPSGFLKTS